MYIFQTVNYIGFFQMIITLHEKGDIENFAMEEGWIKIVLPGTN